jgi:bacillithiol biosynthesis deacetylase BshB1
MKLDILAFGAHPDDVELSAGGTIAKHASLGYKVGVVDLTQGELGTRGSGPLRLKEASAAAKILGLTVRENLGLPDGFFEVDEENIRSVIHMIRKYQPNLVLANAISDRHPDHGQGAQLVKKACFLSGLPKIRTYDEAGEEQEAYRPPRLLHYIQFMEMKPDLIVDISGYLETKMESVLAYSSQFFDPNSEEPETMISGKGFLEDLRGRASKLGMMIGKVHGEGYVSDQAIGLSELKSVF